MIEDEELDADYFVHFYTDMFGSNTGTPSFYPDFVVPYPKATSVEERLENIKAIEKDVENRLNVTISHIPPHEIIDKNPSAVKHLHELMHAIDEARLSHVSFSKLNFVLLYFVIVRSSQRTSTPCTIAVQQSSNYKLNSSWFH